MTPQVKAVIPVHFAGLPAPIAAIRELVGPDVAIIEDAAHALGGHSGEGEVGSCAHSDMAIFSFHPVKAITSAEGGIVTTRDPEPGRSPRGLPPRTAWSATPSASCIPRAPATRGPGTTSSRTSASTTGSPTCTPRWAARSWASSTSFVAARNAVAARYREGLAGIDGLELPPQRRRRTPCTPTTCSSSTCARAPPAGWSSTTAPRERDPRSGPLHPGLPPPLLPQRLRLRPRALPRGRALLRRLPLAALLPGPDRGRAGPGDRGRARGDGRWLSAPPSRRVRDRRPPRRRGPPHLRDRRGRRQPQPRPGDRARADRRRRRGRRRRGQVPDLLGRGPLLVEDARLRVPGAAQRQEPLGAARGHRAAPRVAGRAARPRRRARDRTSSPAPSTPRPWPSSTRSACRR